jgi:hypothetical protein
MSKVYVQKVAEKNQPSGYAGLGSDGKLIASAAAEAVTRRSPGWEVEVESLAG